MARVWVWRLLLLAFVAAIPFPATASSHDRANGQASAGYRIGIGAAQIARLSRGTARADPDHDGLTTRQELRIGTNPHRFDTDGDGYGDGDEIRAGTNPRNPHSFPIPPAPPAPLAQPAPVSEWSGPPPGGMSEEPGSEEGHTGEEPDTTPPQTTIDSGPSGTTTSTSAVFGFSSSESGSTFECRLDSGPWSACTSPRPYSSLAVGAHTFSVRATDAAGNTDPSAATRGWTIDSISVSCTQTLSPGANLSNAISNAASGAVLCLEGGFWSFNISNVDKSSTVTVSSAEGTMASLGHSQLSKSSKLRFQDLHFTDGVDLLGSSAEIEILNNEFTGEYGVRANGEDASHHTAVTSVLIEGNKLHDLDFTGSEGVAGGYGMTLVNGVERFTIRDNTIKSVANDYIQSASPVDFTVDGNTFLGPSLREGRGEIHQDLWQIFGGGDDIVFTNNVARNTGTNESLLFQEGAFHNVQVENNLFVNDSDGYTCKIYQQQGFVFRDNTIVDSHWGCLFQYRTTEPAGSGYEVDHNIFVGTEDNPGISTESGVSHWGTFDYNVSDDGSADEPHSISNWHPEWVDTTSYSPKGLPFAAGYSVP